MKILNRFLLKHFLRILLLSVAAFIGIYLLIDFFEKVGDFIDYKASANDYLSYLFNSIPVICVQILPLAVLMSVVLTLGTLGRSNEITAMRACGLSLWRIVQPLMLLAFCLSLLLLGLSEFVVPINNKALYNLLEIKLEGKQQIFKRNELWYRDNDRIINIRVANPDQKTLSGVTIFTLNTEPKIIMRQEAPKAFYSNGHWLAPTLTERDFSADDGDLLTLKQLQQQQLEINRKPEDFIQQGDQNNSLTFLELRELVRTLDREGIDATHQRVDMHNRLAAPFTCLIMAFLGVPFSLQRGRNSNIALGIGLTLGIGVIYFIIHSLVTSFGYSGAFPPILAAWTANTIFLMLGIWMLLSVRE